MLITLFSCGKGTEIPAKQKIGEEQPFEVRYSKELEEARKSLKADIRIKLKKDAKGGYSWEITGKDAREVLKANETLRKGLSDDRP
ncbi:MAG: hypothetical protein N2745_03765 [Syntrophorhabdaceae bacterium]|nr:hypothetical protein [Syntrophorhabdaceae bacterium]